MIFKVNFLLIKIFIKYYKNMEYLKKNIIKIYFIKNSLNLKKN
jgi:hypothetical protein